MSENNALTVRQETGISPQRATRLAREKIYAGIPDDDVELALAICARYNLDPLLKHVQLIPGNKKDESGQWVKSYSVYVTRDGLLHVAHESGIPFAVVFGEPQAKTNPYTSAKDIYLTGTLKRAGHPDLVAGLWFSEYQGTDRNGNPIGAWKTHPAAMHQKVVEVYLLRRGFDVSLPAYEEVQPNAEPVEPQNGNGHKSNGQHWIEQPKVRARFWQWTRDELGLSDEEVHEALNVEHIRDFDGDPHVAKSCILAWIDGKAELDEAARLIEEAQGDE